MFKEKLRKEDVGGNLNKNKSRSNRLYKKRKTK